MVSRSVYLLIKIIITSGLIISAFILLNRYYQKDSPRTTWPIVANKCKISGCSDELCSDKILYSICNFKQEFICYRTARCELQKDGRCGWTKTDELLNCLKINK